MTDELRTYQGLSKKFWMHQTVNHSANEYARGIVHTNTVEGYYSIFKRGMTGIYQHCSEKHLHRYLAEFDFRYSNRIRLGVDDVERTERNQRHRRKAAFVSNSSPLRGRMGKVGEKQKRTPKTKDKRQYERFVETARKFGCDESEEEFERAFSKIVPPNVPEQS